jgi:hypothetical protein
MALMLGHEWQHIYIHMNGIVSKPFNVGMHSDMHRRGDCEINQSNQEDSKSNQEDGKPKIVLLCITKMQHRDAAPRCSTQMHKCIQERIMQHEPQTTHKCCTSARNQLCSKIAKIKCHIHLLLAADGQGTPQEQHASTTDSCLHHIAVHIH